MKMKKILVLLLLLIPIMYGLPAGKSEKSEIPKNSENSTKYAVEIVENSVTDNITEIIGNPEDVEVIDGNYSGNET